MKLGWSQATVLTNYFLWPPFFRIFLISLSLSFDFSPCELVLFTSFFFSIPPRFLSASSPTARLFLIGSWPYGVKIIATISPPTSTPSTSKPSPSQLWVLTNSNNNNHIDRYLHMFYRVVFALGGFGGASMVLWVYLDVPSDPLSSTSGSTSSWLCLDGTLPSALALGEGSPEHSYGSVPPPPPYTPPHRYHLIG